MRPAFLGAIGWLLALALGSAIGLGWVTPRKLRAAVRTPATLRGPLDETLACDLIAEATPQALVTCSAANFSTMDDVARLTGVSVGGRTASFCFARAPEWRVLREAGGVPCFSTPPDAARPLEAERERTAEWGRGELAARLRGLAAALASATPRRSRCMHDVWTTVPVLEVDVLNGSNLNPGWEFLSTSWLRAAVEAPQDDARVLEALAGWSGRPWIAVVSGTQRKLARVGSPAEGTPLLDFEHGAFEGLVTLVDTTHAEVECEARFTFASSARLTPRLTPIGGIHLPSFDPPTALRVAGDFRANYVVALGEALNAMTGFRVYPAF